MRSLLRLLLLPLLAVPAHAEFVTSAPPAWNASWDELLLNLQVLIDGTPAEKRALVAGAGRSGLFMDLEDAPDEAEARWAIAAIRDWIEHEEDARVVLQALGGLATLDVNGIEDVFHDLLGHRDPGLRQLAIRYAEEFLGDREVAEAWLTDRWAVERVPRVRASLRRALDAWGLDPATP